MRGERVGTTSEGRIGIVVEVIEKIIEVRIIRPYAYSIGDIIEEERLRLSTHRPQALKRRRLHA